MQLWMAGAALAAVLAWSVWDLARAGRTSAPGMATLRLVGGLGLAAMTVEALAAGSYVAAMLGAGASLPLLGGLVAAMARARRERSTPVTGPVRHAIPAVAEPARERRAA